MNGGIVRKLASGWACLLCSALLCACNSATDQTLEEILDETYPIDPTANLKITNRDGSIRVYGAGGETRTIKVEAIKKAYSTERLKTISVQIEAERKSVSIDTIYPAEPTGALADRSGTVDYVITVPQTIRISQLELGNGEILVEGMRSDEANARLRNGRLFVHNCVGKINAAVATGNVALVWDWWEDDKLLAMATIQDGNAFAYIPGDAAFHLVAHAKTGKIANDFAEQEQRHAEPVNDVDMLVDGGGNAAIQLEATDGNIKIAEHNP